MSGYKILDFNNTIIYSEEICFVPDNCQLYFNADLKSMQHNYFRFVYDSGAEYSVKNV